MSGWAFTLCPEATCLRQSQSHYTQNPKILFKFMHLCVSTLMVVKMNGFLLILAIGEHE
jgi:hypothetical protein